MRPLPLRHLAGDNTELVTETLAGVATYVLKTGEAVHIHGLGSLVRRTRKARNVSNPATGLPLRLPALVSVGLRASKAMRRVGT